MEKQQMGTQRKVLAIHRPHNLTYYKSFSSDDQGGDLQQLLAFLCIFISLFYKNKYTIWISLFLFMSSLFVMNTKSDGK